MKIPVFMCLSCLLVAGCKSEIKWVQGPADFNLSETMWTPGLSIRIEDGGFAYFGETGFMGDDPPALPTVPGIVAAGGAPPVMPQP